jgi:hypothetical protein
MSEAAPGASTPNEQRRANLRPPWQRGQSGNPAGRRPGSRQRLSDDFLRALSDDFAEHGPETIARLRDSDPATYVRVIASLMPRTMEPTRLLEELTDDELVGAIDLVRRLLAAGDMAQVALERASGEEPHSAA